MRRMLDPKTIAGGGGEKLYCHHIGLNGAGAISGNLYLDYYSKNQKEFTTIKQFGSAFNGKYLICSGYVISDGKRCTPMYIKTSSNNLYITYINSYNSSETKSIDSWSINDYVYEVE